jgi:hypothetical protein
MPSLIHTFRDLIILQYPLHALSYPHFQRPNHPTVSTACPLLSTLFRGLIIHSYSIQCMDSLIHTFRDLIIRSYSIRCMPSLIHTFRDLIVPFTQYPMLSLSYSHSQSPNRTFHTVSTASPLWRPTRSFHTVSTDNPPLFTLSEAFSRIL